MFPVIQTIPPYDLEEIDHFFSEILKEYPQSVLTTIVNRIEFYSQKFLGCPYILGALGEGPSARFDQNPLYRYDGFDCLTYVNTVLALSHSHTLEDFKAYLTALNYKNRKIDYLFRHHFMSVDWNPENEKLGVIENVTKKIVDESNVPLAKSASTLIDRPNWFKHRQSQDIKLLKEVDILEVNFLLEEMRGLASFVHLESSTIDYLALEDLFDKNKNPCLHLFAQIPHASIIEIVRPNWDLRDKIGTHLHISHLGFALRHEDELVFRHASLSQQRVIDESLIQYLSNCLASPTIKGIHILRIKESPK